MVLLLSSTIFSCKKENTESLRDIKWVKVFTDSAIYYPGKIRADLAGNMFCSYNYRDYGIDTNSAINKLDTNGNILWEKRFPDLAIYDFVILNEKAILLSYKDDIITLTEISDPGHITTLGSYNSPVTYGNIRRLDGMKIFITKSGNFNISGAITYLEGNDKIHTGFMMEVSTSYILNWSQVYIFPEITPAVVTGCAQADDGYLLFGNVQYKDPLTTEFFVLKCKVNGDLLWIKYYQTSSNDTTQYYGYHCNTSDIIPSRDGNFYACAFNDRFNVPTIVTPPIFTTDDNSARVFKISPSGDISIVYNLKYGFQNEVADLVLNPSDGGLIIGLNPVVLVGVHYLGTQTSFVARFNSNLSLLSVSNNQTIYSDFLGSICALPDGYFAVLIMIQSFGKEKYKLEIVKTRL